MTNTEIEKRLATLEKMMARERNNSTLATLNRCYEKLLMKLDLQEPSHDRANRSE